MRIILRGVITVIAIITMFFPLAFSGVFYRSDAKALVVSGDNMQEFTNGVFEFSKDIIVEGNTTLLVENATIRFIQAKPYEFELSLRSSSTGNPHLIVRNATFESTKPFKVSLWGNSSAEFYGLSFSYYLELFDYSTANIFDKSSINYIRSYDFSSVNVIGSDAYYIYAYDYSYVKVSASVLNRIESYDRSKIEVLISSVKYSVIADDFSQVFLSGSSFSGNVLSKKTSNISFLSCFLSKTKFEASDYGNLTLTNSTIITSKPPSDISLRGNSSMFIYGSQVTDTSISAYQNSTLNVQNSNMTFVYIKSFENAAVRVSDSTIDWLVECAESSSLHGRNSLFTVASGENFSNLFFDGCTIAELRCAGFTKAIVSSSVVKEASFGLTSVNLTLNNLRTGFFDNLGFITESLNVNLLNTRVKDAWNLRFYGSSNVSIQDSEIMNLGAFDFSKVWMWNTTFVSINVKEASEVYLWSHLTVRIIDYFGNSIEGANVTVSTRDASMESKITGKDGVAAFELFEKFANASELYYSRKYDLTVVFDGRSMTYDLYLNNRQSFVFVFPAPWWYWHLIFGLISLCVVVLGLGLFVLFRRRRKPKSN